MTDGFMSILTILFIAFKLLGVVDWPWYVCLSPILIDIAVSLLLIVAVTLKAYKEYNDKN